MKWRRQHPHIREERACGNRLGLFKNSFQSALQELAALKHDLKFKGPTILFSWASRDEFNAYFEDESTVSWSAPHFRNFLRDLDAQGFKRIDLAAHSMGNRLFLESLGIARIPQRAGELIFLSPDVDFDTFQEAVRTMRSNADHLTMYGSRYDQALLLSGSLHRQPRAGLLIQGSWIDGADTIDISDVDPTFLHHSYLTSATAFESDIAELLAGKQPPNRTHLVRDTVVIARWRVR